MRDLRSVLALSMCGLFLMPSIAGAHPASGYAPYQPPDAYGQPGFEWDPEMSIGEVTFVDHYPDKDSLADDEKYILFGNRESSLGHSLMPWSYVIQQVASAYFTRFGRLPDQVTPEVYRSAYGMGSDEMCDQIECLANPITGEYTRLDSTGFIPGGVYMKVLSDAELQSLARYRPDLGRVWFDGHAGKTRVELNGPVIYYRIYGHSSLIKNTIATNVVPQD